MKKYFSFLLFSALCFIFFSCNKENKNEKIAETTSINYVKSVLFYDEGSLWTEDSKGEMVWATTLSCGTVLNAYPSIEGSTSTVTESKLAVRSGKTDQIDYTKVSFNDEDYWIQSVLIIPNSETKVIIGEDVHIYNSPDIASVSNVIIPEGSIVAMTDSVKDEEFGGTFAKITYKDSKKAYRDVYVKGETISTNFNDTTAKRIIEKYKTCKNLAVKQELYANLLELDSVSSIFYNQIDKIKNELFPVEVEKQIEESSSDYFEEESIVPETVTAIDTDDSTLDYDDYYEFE